MRVMYFGMTGDFSIAPLAALLGAGVDVCGVVLPGNRSADRPIEPVLPRPASTRPPVNPSLARTLVHVPAAQDRPSLWSIGAAQLRPDVACVSCFPQRTPHALLELPPHGFLNLHPSLLPDYRGPHPLFWIFRNGETSTGVTIHFMDEGLDTGDIAAQAALELPDGISGVEADRLCSTRGGKLMVEVVHSLERGTLARRMQPEGGSTYPAPSAGDFALDTSWPARRAFNFMRGTREWNQPYMVELDGERLSLTMALSYSAEQKLDRAYVRSAREVWIQFTPGVLCAA